MRFPTESELRSVQLILAMLFSRLHPRPVDYQFATHRSLSSHPMQIILRRGFSRQLVLTGRAFDGSTILSTPIIRVPNYVEASEVKQRRLKSLRPVA